MIASSREIGMSLFDRNRQPAAWYLRPDLVICTMSLDEPVLLASGAA